MSKSNKDKTSILIDLYKPKCDMFNGSYNTNGDSNKCVTTVNLTFDQMLKIHESSSLQKVIEDANFNIDPTFDKAKGSIKFRLKKLCEWNVDEFYDSIPEETRRIMVGKQYHVQQQQKLRDSLKLSLGFMKETKTSKVMMTAAEKLSKHMKISVEEALKLLNE